MLLCCCFCGDTIRLYFRDNTLDWIYSLWSSCYSETLRAQKRNERGNTWVPKKKSKNKEEADVALAIERSRLDEEEREKKVLERKKSYDAAVAESKMMSDAQAEKRALYEKPKRIFLVSGDPPLRFEGIFKTIPGDGHCGWRASPMYQHKKMSIEEVKTLVNAWICTNRVRWIESPWNATQDQYHMVVLGSLKTNKFSVTNLVTIHMILSRKMAILSIWLKNLKTLSSVMIPFPGKASFRKRNT